MFRPPGDQERRGRVPEVVPAELRQALDVQAGSLRRRVERSIRGLVVKRRPVLREYEVARLRAERGELVRTQHRHE